MSSSHLLPPPNLLRPPLPQHTPHSPFQNPPPKFDSSPLHHHTQPKPQTHQNPIIFHIYTVLGKLFLIVGYVLLYIIGESYVAAGGELIFEVNGSVGANLFHILGAIPDAIVLLGSGEITEIWTTYAARIMVISIMPFVVSQLPQVLHLSSDGQDLTILIALIVSVILTIAYFFYEFYCEPLIQTSRINYVEHRQVMSDS